MRRITALLRIIVATAAVVVLLSPTPASANANRVVALNQETWSWSGSAGIDRYILRARVGIELNSDNTQGRFRLRLNCFYAYGSNEPVPHSCDFEFDPDVQYHASWCHSGYGCSFRKLTNKHDTSRAVWVGSWHPVIHGHTYLVRATSFRAIFRSGTGHKGAWHNLCSKLWTKGSHEGVDAC